MERFSLEELAAIALSFKNREKEFPSQEIFILEIKSSITFDRESSDNSLETAFHRQHSIDEDNLADKLNNLLSNQPEEFNKLYLAIKKFWEVEVVNLQERLKELRLIPA